MLGEKHSKASVGDEWINKVRWWNDTDRGNWCVGRKTLYSVGGRWMNEYGALVEWCWQGKLKCWEEKRYTSWVVDELMIMERWWNDTGRGNWSAGRKTFYSVCGRWMNEYGALVDWYWQGKLKYWEKNIIQRWWQMNEWVWCIGGTILTGETEVLGEKALYIVRGRWMNEYGLLVEWYWQRKLDCREKNVIQRRW